MQNPFTQMMLTMNLMRELGIGVAKKVDKRGPFHLRDHKHTREIARHRRQIAKGQLTRSNGLVGDPDFDARR